MQVTEISACRQARNTHVGQDFASVKPIQNSKNGRRATSQIYRAEVSEEGIDRVCKVHAQLRSEELMRLTCCRLP